MKFSLPFLASATARTAMTIPIVPARMGRTDRFAPSPVLSTVEMGVGVSVTVEISVVG